MLRPPKGSALSARFRAREYAAIRRPPRWLRCWRVRLSIYGRARARQQRRVERPSLGLLPLTRRAYVCISSENVHFSVVCVPIRACAVSRIDAESLQPAARAGRHVANDADRLAIKVDLQIEPILRWLCQSSTVLRRTARTSPTPQYRRAGHVL